MRCDVFISGGGIAGLMLAAILTQGGRRVVLAEMQGSPALMYKGELLQPKSLALLDKLGLLEPLRGEGRDIRTIAMCELKEEPLAAHHLEAHRDIRFDYGVLEPPYNYALMVPHERLKTLLLERAEATGLLTLLKPGKLTALVKDTGSGFAEEALVDVKDGCERVRADFFVGAEGRNSPTRAHMDIPAYRRGYNHHFLTVSFPSPPSLREARIISRGGRFLGLFPLPVGMVRTVLLIKPEEYQVMRQAGLPAFYQAYNELMPGLDGYVQEVAEWKKIQLMIPFRYHADRYVSGNMAIIGDAAHNVHPMAGEGMNLAIQDADVLGRLLLWMHGPDGKQPSDALAWYERVRRPRTRHLLWLSHQSALAYAHSHPSWAWMRAQVLNRIQHSDYLHYKYMLNVSGLGFWPDSPADLLRQAGLWPDRRAAAASERQAKRFGEYDDYPWLALG